MDPVSPSLHHPAWTAGSSRTSTPRKRTPITNPPRHQQEPGYVIIKRWVPEWEQTVLWEHTRRRRGDGKVMLEVEDRHHHHSHSRHHSTGYEFVRAKSKSRHRSKSPGLLMYLAGGRPR